MTEQLGEYMGTKEFSSRNRNFFTGNTLALAMTREMWT